MEVDRVKSILESLLFTAEGPLSVDRLRGAIGGIDRKDVTQGLRELQAEYETQQRGVRLMEVANGFQLRTPREHADYIKNLLPVKAARMSRANLETLAIVAYKQPITKAEIEEIRGVNVDGVVSTLLERRLVRIVARKDVPGKPFLYGTTKEFLETFNLKDLSGLPTLKEMEEMTQALVDDAETVSDGSNEAEESRVGTDEATGEEGPWLPPDATAATEPGVAGGESLVERSASSASESASPGDGSAVDEGIAQATPASGARAGTPAESAGPELETSPTEEKE